MSQRGSILWVCSCLMMVNGPSKSHSEDVEMEEQVELETVGWGRSRR